MYNIACILNPEYDRNRREMREAYLKQRLASATFVDWHPDIKWQPLLNINGASYPRHSLFKVKPAAMSEPNTAKRGQYVDSPNRQFRYIEYAWNHLQPMQTWYGSKTGDVMFKGEVVIPALYERDNYYKNKVFFSKEPWMSLTPAEVMSMRGGTRRAKGRVIIAGLGLGHQLIEVAKRKQVKEIVLVEQSQELVDWLLPVIRPKIDKPLEIIVDDAMQAIPRLTADIALVDIFKSYGNNDYEIRKLREQSFSIGHIWGWGTATINGSIW